MSARPPTRISVAFATRAQTAVMVATVGFFLAGCPPEQKPVAFPWKTAAAIRPIIPQPVATRGADLPEVTSIPGDLEPPTLRLVPIRSAPPRPRVPAPSTSSNDAVKSGDGPLIVPQMTPAESAAAEQEINANLSAAEKNLGTVSGKTLNAAQTDMANKSKGFIADAREAARAGDWPRARSLAKKAQVLSDELARSL